MEVRRALDGSWYTLEASRTHYNDDAMRVWEDCQLVVKGCPANSYMESIGNERDGAGSDGNASMEASVVTEASITTDAIEVRRARDGEWYTLKDFEACCGVIYGRIAWQDCQAVVRGAVVSTYMEATGNASGWDWEDGGASEHVAEQRDASEDGARRNVWDIPVPDWENSDVTDGAATHVVQDGGASEHVAEQFDASEVAARGNVWDRWNSDVPGGASPHVVEEGGASEHVDKQSDASEDGELQMHEVDEVVSVAKKDSGLTLTMLREALHEEARGVLEYATDILHRQHEPTQQLTTIEEMNVAARWENWRAYVCTHREHEKMIGSGIVRVSAQMIWGTKDANRRGRPRVDLVLHHRDSSYVRLHPGSHRRNDAQLKVSPPSASEHGVSAAQQWKRIWSEDGVFSINDARLIPQGDRIGRKEAWKRLSSLRHDVPFDITDGTKFLWWLWVASFGSKLEPVVGCGLRKAEVVRDMDESKIVRFERVNDTCVHVGLSYLKVRGGAWRMEFSVWLHAIDGPPDL